MLTELSLNWLLALKQRVRVLGSAGVCAVQDGIEVQGLWCLFKFHASNSYIYHWGHILEPLDSLTVDLLQRMSLMMELRSCT